ncbi:translation elongation factor 2 [Marasmius fiardii PR-910]|nr:translation elongation factor 2 [Marasmius fiardii PR-910]
MQRKPLSGKNVFKQLRRGFASFNAKHEPSKIRNMALVAHIDSGKTTLTESILYKSSYLASSGSVDTGSTTTDFLPAERERGITIQSASIPVKWKSWTFNLIDTPGHADFGMEVESASRVVDGAVVLIDSVEGVEAQTKGVWRQLERYGVPTRMMFLNKLDRPGASFRSSLLSLLTHRFHPNPMALTLPIASFTPADYSNAEPGIQGIVDLVNWEVWRWDEDDNATCHPLPRETTELSSSGFFPHDHPIIPHLPAARTQMLENLSMFSEELMENLLSLSSEPSYLSLETHQILPHLRKCTLENKILPVVCGSAIRNIGTEILMNYVGELFASPLDVLNDQLRNAPLRLLAWKVGWDKRKGWMTYVRVYSGSLKKQSVIFNASRNQKEKATKLLLLYASEAEEVDELPFGSVGVVLGLKYTRTGDTLVSAGALRMAQSTAMDIIPPPAVISSSIIPNSHSDLKPVQEALESLSRTDPSVRVDMQEGQILVHGLGDLHLEIVEGRLREEWQAQFEVGKRRVSYREGLGPANVNSGQMETVEIAGTSASVSFEVRSLAEHESGNPLWDGNVVIDQHGKPISSPESSSTTAETCIAAGIFSALSNSPHSSLPISRVRVQIMGSSTPSTLSILTGAAAMILRKRLQNAGPGPVMEPYFLVKITVPEDSLGQVVKDLTEHGAELQDLADGGSALDAGEFGGFEEDGNYIPPKWMSPSASSSSLKGAKSAPQLKRSIQAMAPLSQMLDYNNRLRALSGGHGQFEMTNAGFRIVSEARRLEILREIGRA